MTPEFVAHWVSTHPLTPIQVDCATTVMLKIIDGKCKMQAAEKQVMALLYAEVSALPGQLLDTAIHELITAALSNPDDSMKNLIYEQRLLAETAISRPVMKSFKAMIRQQGLLEAKQNETAEED